MWYDIYEAFPPKEEPRFDRPAPKMPLKTIFYAEDKIRAKFHKHNKHVGIYNFAGKGKTLTQRFLDIYKQLDGRYSGSVPEDQIYKEAIETLRRDQEFVNEADEKEKESLSVAFQQAQSKPSEVSVNIKDIFEK